jgi:Mrp family chromosome partitioning ATPase
MSTQINGHVETQRSSAEVVQPQTVTRQAKHGRRGLSTPARPGSDYYDTLLFRIVSRLETSDGAGGLLGLTSGSGAAGVSTLAANLAIRAADHGLGPVLLADCNFRNPTLHKFLNAARDPGLTDVLADQAVLDDCSQPTSISGLSFLGAGKIGHAHRLGVTSEQINALVPQLREQYALVICDLPDATRLGPSLFLACALDVTLLVVRSGKATGRATHQAVRSLLADGVRLTGAVLTDHRNVLPGWLERLL